MSQQRYWWKKPPAAGQSRPAAEPAGYWWKQDKAEAEEGEVCALRPRPGQRCPECGQGTLAYNGLFLLTCPQCNYVAEGGANF